MILAPMPACGACGGGPPAPRLGLRAASRRRGGAARRLGRAAYVRHWPAAASANAGAAEASGSKAARSAPAMRSATMREVRNGSITLTILLNRLHPPSSASEKLLEFRAAAEHRSPTPCPSADARTPGARHGGSSAPAPRSPPLDALSRLCVLRARLTRGAPYSVSPTTGWPSDCICTRIWCVRPVSIRTSTSVNAPYRVASRSSTWTCDTALRPSARRVVMRVRRTRSRAMGRFTVMLSFASVPCTSAM